MAPPHRASPTNSRASIPSASGVAESVAVFYSGTTLHLMHPTDIVGGFIATVLISVPILYFGMRYRVLSTLSARAASRRGSA